jgi:hypothetical protein
VLLKTPQGTFKEPLRVLLRTIKMTFKTLRTANMSPRLQTYGTEEGNRVYKARNSFLKPPTDFSKANKWGD